MNLFDELIFVKPLGLILHQSGCLSVMASKDPFGCHWVVGRPE